MSVGQSPDWTSLWVVAGPQSNMIFSPSMSATYAEPKRVGVGVGVPAPRMWREVGSLELDMGVFSIYVSPWIACQMSSPLKTNVMLRKMFSPPVCLCHLVIVLAEMRLVTTTW